MELKGKQLSLGAKIVSVFVVLFGFCLGVFVIKPLDWWNYLSSVIALGGFVALVFAPIDVSFWLEKFVAIAQTRQQVVYPNYMNGKQILQGEKTEGKRCEYED